MSRNQYGDRHNEVLAHQDHLTAFIQFVGLNRTAETVDLYRGKLRPLLRTWDALPPEKWTKGEFETYIALGKAGKLPGQLTKWSVRTVQMVLTAAKLFGEYLRSHDVPVPEFWTSVKKPRSHAKEAKFFTLEQAKRLLEAAHGTRYFARIALGIGAGMRRSEQTRAQWSDVDFDNHTILVHRNKVGMSHRIPMTPFLEEALLTIRQDSGPIIEGGLSNLTRGMKDITKAAGVPYASLHALRHGFASELIARGVPLNVVAKLGGWTNLKTLGRYAHVMEGAMKDATKLLA